MVFLLELFILLQCVLPPRSCLLGIVSVSIVNSYPRIRAVSRSLLLEHLSVAILHKGLIDEKVEYFADALLLFDGPLSFFAVGFLHLHVLNIFVELKLPPCEVLLHSDHSAVLDACILSVLRAVPSSLHGFVDAVHTPVELCTEDLPSTAIVLKFTVIGELCERIVQMRPCRRDLGEELEEDIIELVEFLAVVGVELERRKRDA